MARVELAATGASAWLASRSIRYFFVLLALFGIFIASIVFVPVFLKFAAGTFPIAWGLNVHGALMAAWLALFLAQALLASTGRLALHRKLGAFGIVLGFPVWAFMVLVEIRSKVVHPLDPDLSKVYDLDLTYPNAMALLDYREVAAKPDALAAASVDGIDPNIESIRAERYAGSRAMYLYINKDRMNAVGGMLNFVGWYVRSLESFDSITTLVAPQRQADTAKYWALQDVKL